MDREAWRAAIHGVAKIGHDWATELNWTEPRGQMMVVQMRAVGVNMVRRGQILGTNSHTQTCKLGLSWCYSGWESACQCRRHRFECWSRKITHATEQQNPRATATEPVLQSCELQLLKPVCLEPGPLNKWSRCNEKPTYHSEEYLPLAPARKSLCTATKTQCSQK